MAIYNSEASAACESEACGGGLMEFAKNLLLSSDEKLLRKHGLKDQSGEYTYQAKELVLAKLVEDNKDYLISIANAKEEEKK